MDSALGGRPTLVIFTIPIMLSAYVGGLGPGLLATVLSYLQASYYLLPPIYSFHVTSAVEQWQQAFVAFAGVVISVLNEALHRARRRADLATAEQRRAQAAIVQLAAIVESSDDAIISKDFNGIIVSWNSGAERMFGYTASEMVGTSIIRLIPGDRQKEEEHILGQIRKGERVRHFETVRQTKEGRSLNVSVTVSPIKDIAGKVMGASKIVRDITVQKAHEREIARLTRLYAALSQVNQAIVVTRERADLFAKVCRALVEYGGFRMAWVGLVDPVTRAVHSAGQCGDVTNYIAQAAVSADGQPEGRGPIGMAIREGRTSVCNDFAGDPRTGLWREAAERAGYQALAVLPIRQDGQVCGSINVYADESGFFQDREIALLEEAAGDVSFGVDNLAREEVRRKAEQGMRVSEERFRAYVEQAADAMFVHDFSGRFIEVNQQACANLGYPREELLQMSVLDVEIDFDLAQAQAAWSRIRPDQTLTLGGRQRRKDGSIFPVEVRFGCFDLEGKRCYLGIVRDITERNRAEEALRESEARYHTLFEYAPDGIVIADPESTYLDANASACRMLGYTREELIGLHASDIVVQEEVQHIGPALTAIKSGPDYHREWRFRRKDGSTFPAEVIATQMPDGNLLGMIRDITERITAGQKIRDQVDELLRWQEVMLNREDRVEALKAEVNAQLARQGLPTRYSSRPPA
jgi:PAS domain S-box-containing protein